MFRAVGHLFRLRQFCSTLVSRLRLSLCLTAHPLPPQVPDEGAYALGAALKANTCLTELGLADNHITANGGRGHVDRALRPRRCGP